MGVKQLWRELSERERVCFRCPLPECQEGSAGCLFHSYVGGRVACHDWSGLQETVRQADGAIEVVFSDAATACLARSGVLKRMRSEAAIQTRIEKMADGSARLRIVKSGER